MLYHISFLFLGFSRHRPVNSDNILAYRQRYNPNFLNILCSTYYNLIYHNLDFIEYQMFLAHKPLMFVLMNPDCFFFIEVITTNRNKERNQQTLILNVTQLYYFLINSTFFILFSSCLMLCILFPKGNKRREPGKLAYLGKI